MIRIIYYTTIFYFFFAISSYGQPVPTLTPATPDITALGRYGMQAPDLSSGQAQISVPLFELKEGGISFPIQLNYSYSGFRMREESTWVGLGWILTADAIITRIIKSAPDNAHYLIKKFDDYDQSQIPVGYESLVDDRQDYEGARFNLTANRLLNKLEDGKPDLYVYNFNGHSGRFIYINGEAYSFPYNDLYIKLENGEFIIKTPDGLKYIFEEADISHDWRFTIAQTPHAHMSVSFVAGWRLKRIESSTTGAWVNFYYTDYTKFEKGYEIANSVSFNSDNRINEGPLNQGGYINFFTTSRNDGKHLERIESNNTIIKFISGDRIDFPETKALKRIEVYSREDLVNPKKSIVLENDDYFGQTNNKETSWLKLNGVKETSSTGETRSYSFYYNSASGNKKGFNIDHWGFQNDRSNQSLIPEIDEIKYYKPATGWPFNAWADRSSDFHRAKGGALTKIVYPTGGYTEYSYESAGGRGIRVDQITDFDGNHSVNRYYSYFPDEPVPAPHYKYSRVSDLFYTNDSHDFTSFGVCDDDNGDDIFSRQYLTVTADSRATLDYYDENTNFYSKVTEFIGSPDGIGGKTEYEFDREPESRKTYLIRKSDYAYNNPDPVRVEESKYTVPLLKTIRYWGEPVEIFRGVALECGLRAGGMFTPPPDPRYLSILLGHVVVGGGSLQQRWLKLDKTIITLDGVREETAYSYHLETPPKHTFPLKLEQSTSDERLLATELFYPGDFSAENGVDEMWNKSNVNFRNFISPVVRSRKYLENKLISQFQNAYAFENGLILSKSYHEILPGTGEEIVYNYDHNDFGDIVSIEKERDIMTSYLWGYNGAYVIAEAKSANPFQIFYTSFEEDGVAFIVDGKNSAKTGNKVYNSGSYTFPSSFNPPSGTSYRMTYWFYNGTEWGFSGEVDYASSISPADATKLDEIRVYPEGARMFTYTHKPLVGVTSITDDNGQSRYYEYDDLQRLKLIRDDKENIIKAYNYYYSVKSN